MKTTKRQLRKAIKKVLLSESGDPAVALYVQAIERLGPREFARGLVAALGSADGYIDGHAGIIDYIERYR
jgi:hypothetical protein